MCVAGVSANQLLALGPKAITNSLERPATSAQRATALTLDTRAVQTAIDSCNVLEADFVYFPPEVPFSSAQSILKSHVTLHVDIGAQS